MFLFSQKPPLPLLLWQNSKSFSVFTEEFKYTTSEKLFVLAHMNLVNGVGWKPQTASLILIGNRCHGSVRWVNSQGQQLQVIFNKKHC